MPDIGGVELLLITVVALLVIGPERLPETLRTLGLWLGRLRRSFFAVKAEIEKEIGMDEIKRQLHNESIMAEMKRIEEEVKHSVDETQIDPHKIDAHLPSTESTAGTETETTDETSAEENPATESLPKSEAQLEAAYEHKMRTQQTTNKDSA